MIEPVIVWVVDTGMPQIDARITVAAPPVSAQKPENGFNLVIRLPIVRTIRQPPVSVPRPIAAWAERMIQIGRSFMFGRYMKWYREEGSANSFWFATRRPAMMPMVFCASLEPWESENAAAEPSCARRNHRSTAP